jgi:hypothetical protein
MAEREDGMAMGGIMPMEMQAETGVMAGGPAVTAPGGLATLGQVGIPSIHGTRQGDAKGGRVVQVHAKRVVGQAG